MNEKELTENEKKKEYLRSYRKSIRREKQILEEIQKLRLDKMFPSIVNDGMPGGSSQKDLSDYAVIIDELIQELKEERLKRAERRKRIESSIHNLDNEDEQEVLRLRYIQGMKWEEVAVKIGYCLKQTHRIHSDALKNIKMT